MVSTTAITLALASFGLTSVAFVPVSGTGFTGISVTDQPFEDHAVAEMIAFDILEPLGVEISSYCSNALFKGVEGKGAVFFTRSIFA